MKKKANILIETIVGINIILVMFLIVTLLINDNRKSVLKRKEIEEANRVIYCIMQEIKYNMTLEEVLNETNKKEFYLDNYDDFLLDLSSKDLISMRRGNDIFVNSVKTEDEDKLYVEIKVDIDNVGGNLERKFIKYRWMEHYE